MRNACARAKQQTTSAAATHRAPGTAPRRRAHLVQPLRRVAPHTPHAPRRERVPAVALGGPQRRAALKNAPAGRPAHPVRQPRRGRRSAAAARPEAVAAAVRAAGVAAAVILAAAAAAVKARAAAGAASAVAAVAAAAAAVAQPFPTTGSSQARHVRGQYAGACVPLRSARCGEQRANASVPNGDARYGPAEATQPHVRAGGRICHRHVVVNVGERARDAGPVYRIEDAAWARARRLGRLGGVDAQHPAGPRRWGRRTAWGECHALARRLMPDRRGLAKVEQLPAQCGRSTGFESVGAASGSVTSRYSQSAPCAQCPSF
eukprot:12373-Chlamydomonas_euryale.AAC.1